MVKTVKAYDLLISCPSDITDGIPGFISIIEEAIRDFNSTFGRDNSIVVRTRIYSKDVCGNYGVAPQKQINRQIVYDADIQVAIFWTRFGTPTESFLSGTEEEIELISEARKPILLCFLDVPCPPSRIEPDQFAKVQAFRRNHSADAFYHVAKTIDDFTVILKKALQRFIIERINEVPSKETDGKQILWVDDRPENVVYERRTFLAQHMGITFVLSTAQALRALSQASYDLIISDMARDEGDTAGLDLLLKVRTSKTKNSAVPFVIYCGKITDHMKTTVERLKGQGITSNALELFRIARKCLTATGSK